MLNNLISDFTQNAWWELTVISMMTVIARIFRLTFGKKMTTKHEIGFWVICICCGTVALSAANIGIIKPLQNELANKGIASPNLHCSVVQGAIGKSAASDSGSVNYQLKVVNSGSPSIAWKWRLKIILTTGQTVEAEASENPHVNTVINPITKQQTAIFENFNYLPQTLLENPLGTGAGKVGWIVFSFDTATEDDLQRIGNKFILEFEDSEGKTTTHTNVLTKKGGAFSDAP